MTNRWTLTVATRNGSGSQSANNILAKTLFRMGIPVGAKNLFPSNIQGLPTWFTIRVDDRGFVGRKPKADIVVAMNSATFVDDQSLVADSGYFFFNADLRMTPELVKAEAIAIPFRDLVKKISDSVKMSKLLTNTIYVGILTELAELDQDILKEVIQDQFKNKASVVDLNLKAIEVGREFARVELSKLKSDFKFKAKGKAGAHKDKLFIDGNSAAAMGLACGGCTFMSWYPITPSSSLAESFQKFGNNLRSGSSAVVQAEDELSAINMVLGAGWAGARAITTTSGPGLSLMAEGAGLSYFAEIPAVIWDVQRAGPSTGLPTRTLQGDLGAAYRLSHGDTEHVVLLPGTAEECFTFAKVALDLAEELQTLVIVLTDLDLGMNFQVSEKYQVPASLSRGKVLNANDLAIKDFKRYQATDTDAVPFRTLPGLSGAKGAYFTRGTGHDEKAAYSENPEVFKKTLNRLKQKMLAARSRLPKPVMQKVPNAEVGIIAFGSTDYIIPEVIQRLQEHTGKNVSYLRPRALPLADEVFDFVSAHKQIYVLEQNRDGQLCRILLEDDRLTHRNLRSVCFFDGLPLSADEVVGSLHV